MVWRIIVCWCWLLLCAGCVQQHTCLPGRMTDVQGWVDEKGELTKSVDFQGAIDLSAISDPVPVLQQKMTIMRSSRDVYVKYLSMARCRLSRVPTIFGFRDSLGRDLADTVEYITFYGNAFQGVSFGDQYDVHLNATRARERVVAVGYQRNSNAIWSTGFKETDFPHLRELDLRSCSIQILSALIFKGMPKLEALYIGENSVIYIDADAFIGLENLRHLDFSHNEAYDTSGNYRSITTETADVFSPLKNLASLDFSFTKLANQHKALFKYLTSKLTKLSLCETGFTNLHEDFFNHTSLRILDLSGNNGIIARTNVLRGLDDSLEILYAKSIGLRTMELFKGFHRLEILEIQMNEVSEVSPEVTSTLTSLQILDLDKNRITSWFDPTFTLMRRLKLLSIRDNNINLISDNMIRDMADVNYVAISGNFIVCNCHTRDFFDVALRNEKTRTSDDTSINGPIGVPNIIDYHIGFLEFNDRIEHRPEVFVNCTEDYCDDDLREDLEGNFLLVDFHPLHYICLQVPEGKSIKFSEVVGCNKSQRDLDYEKVIAEGRNKLLILLILPGCLVTLAVGFMFRRNFRYFCITMRNSAMLSLINKNEVFDEGAIYDYDVFVSYCNENRSWVLDHLLPHLERDCSISACLHERDFQVGHSILENIVSCMDRSRSIMLIISQRFLLSQWCQFEMHLAQHRLLETRREALILVLIEEIPRRLRPNTLHYLMLTKTYIQWPARDHERPLFWRRLKKSLLVKLNKAHTDGVSLA